MIGTAFSHYRVLRLLGKGGMGEVYEAEDTKLGRHVALKLLPKHLAAVGERRERFEREARTVALLNHPSIVTIHSVEEVDGLPFLTMELVEGRTLAESIPAKGLPIDRFLKISIPLADAVAAAHQRGVLHRDLKPANVMVTSDARVKVLDFGLAKLKEEVAAADAGMLPTEEQTGEGRMLGTVAYMSPEQAEGKAVDQRSDVFSLGIVLYEMASGERPFKGDTSVSIVTAILRDEPKPITQVRPDLPRDLGRIIKHALAKDTEHRYQTAKDLRNDLEELKDSLSSGELERVPAAPAAPARQSWARWMAAVVVVALLTTVAYLAWKPSSTPAARPFDAMRVGRVTADGSASSGAAISRDGRYVAYVGGGIRERSLNLRQLGTDASVQLVPPTATIYTGVTFSPDGGFLYYSGYPTNANVATLYRVPVLGGVPQKLLDDIDSIVTFSPDGSQIAFIRNDPRHRVSQLVLGGADGSQPRVLAEKKYPAQFGSSPGTKPAWSADGRLIAAPARETTVDFSIALVDVNTGAATTLAPARWGVVFATEWLPDGRGLLVSARDPQSGPLVQIWRVDYPGGGVRQITSGLDSYTGVSLSGDGRQFVSTAGSPEATLWVGSADAPSAPVQLTVGAAERDGGAGITWTPDGQLIYSSLASGNLDLWSLNPDTRVRRQLTSSPGPDIAPAVSPDGKLVAFESVRDGERRIWVMDLLGGNQRPVSSGSSDQFPLWSRDGEAITFRRVASDDIWLTSRAGAERLLFAPPNGPSTDPLGVPTRFVARAVSREGRLAGYFMRLEGDRAGWAVAVSSAVALPPYQALDILRTGNNVPLTWSADGRAIDAVDPRDQNVWRYPLDGGKPSRVTQFNGGSIRAFAWSWDGQRFALSHGSDRADVVLITEAATR